MNRLTNKNTANTVISLARAVGKTQAVNIVNKLGKLEDIEEELGCPLEALFKALSDRIIYVPYQDSDSYTAIRPRLMRTDEGYFIFDLVDGYEIKLSDYKKSWWLTEDKSE